jgi:8-oxo-dGTP pyrophosphatase MutT (NUDIX family)
LDSEKNPWKTLSSRQIYDNPWISIREDKVIKPAGGEGIYGVVSFKNYAVGIIPIDANNNTWLVGQYRYTLNEYSWEIPMGGGTLGVDPLAGAQRELREETGLIARRWQKILTLHTSNSVTDEIGFVYVAQELEQRETEP